LPFNILQNKDGYVVEGLDFVLQSLQSDTSAIPAKVEEQRNVPAEKPQIVEEKVVPPPQVVDEKVVPVPQIVEEKIVPPPPPIIRAEKPCIVIAAANKKGYILQISSWVTKFKAIRAAKKVKKFPGLQLYIMTERIPSLGLRYRVFIGVFKTREEAIVFCHNFNFDL